MVSERRSPAGDVAQVFGFGFGRPCSEPKSLLSLGNLGFSKPFFGLASDEAWQTPYLARHTELTHHISGADQMDKHALDFGLKRIQLIGRLYRPVDTPMRFQSHDCWIKRARSSAPQQNATAYGSAETMTMPYGPTVGRRGSTADMVEIVPLQIMNGNRIRRTIANVLIV